MPFESYAIVELMGHNRIAGKVTEEVVAGAAMLRVDVPQTSSKQPFTKFYSPSAVYAITPTDEAVAQRAAELFDEWAVPPMILRMPESPQLADKVVVQNGRDYDDDDYDEDDDSGF